MSNYVVSDTSLGSVADAIRTKGGTSAPLEYPQGFIDAIDAISGGGDEPIPEDGKTRIFIHIAEGTPDNRLTFYSRFTASTANNTTVDWGDGTSETLGSTTATDYSHKYSEGGDYVITLTVNSGTISFEGTSGNSGYSIYGSRVNSNNHNRSRIKRIIFGDNVTSVGNYACYYCYSLESITISDSVTSIGANTFYQCYALTSITIPNSVTSIGASAFNNCYALTSATIPDGVTSIGDNAFNNCYALASITIPDGVTSIGASAFYQCYALASITIPDSVTSIGRGAFYNCYGISEYHFKPTTPPALVNTNAFGNIPSDCIIYVPYSEDHSILNAYQQATNWSSYSSKMQEEPT